MLRRQILRELANHSLQRAKLDWILSSRDIIQRAVHGGLTVGVVPMHIVMRGRFKGLDEPLVHHANQSPGVSDVTAGPSSPSRLRCG